GVDDLAAAGTLRFEQGREHAHDEIQRSAPEISEQIERWNGPAPAFADRVQRAAERDVVDIVSRGMRERPGLAPARHAPVHQPRIAAQRYIGTELEALHHAGPKALDERVGSID